MSHGVRGRANVLRSLVGVSGLLLATGSASAQLRVMEWNITNYGGGRQTDIANVVFGTFEGRSANPDIIGCQEILSQSAVDQFLAVLNAPAPGAWGAATFVDGADTDCAFFYRKSKVDFLAQTTIAIGSSSTANQPRNTYRYDVRLKGYTSTGATLAMYTTHMKAQGGTNDSGRRLIEAQRIRDNAEGVDTNGPGSAMPAGYRFIMGGDTNLQTSSDVTYQELVGSQTNNLGRFFDPINTPGTWNNNGSFRFVHTQDPAGSGGMDDRHDQLLICEALKSGNGFSYIGSQTLAYSTTTWNDTNHSYRAWGNDGTSFNTTLTVAGNTMVGPVIAQSIIVCANGGGHCPTFLDLRVPAKATSESTIDFGTVDVGSIAQMPLDVSNAGDVALWSVGGIDGLDYTLAASAGFTAPAGAFVAAPGAAANVHVISMDTSTPGPMNGTIVITSDDPDQPTRVVTLTGVVEEQTPVCPGDADGDLMVGLSDIAVVVQHWGQSLTGPENGDLNGDGLVGLGDIAMVVQNWAASCQ